MATSPPLHDGWLYLGAALLLTASAFSVRFAITDIISLTKIETAQPLPKPEEITVGGEYENGVDGGPMTIKLSTLRSLLKSESDRISGSARCIIMQRCCSDPANIRGIVSDVFSIEKTIYTKATVAVQYLLEGTVVQPAWNESRTVIPHQARTILERLAMVDRTEYMITTAREAATAQQAFWDIAGREVRTWAGVQSHRSHLRKGGERNGPGSSSTLRSSTRPVAAAQSRRQRRHREVMVLHNGDDAISEQDIYQRL